MNESKLRTRAEIAPEFKWNAASVFTSDEAWEKAAEELPGHIQQIAQKRGHLKDGPAVLLETYKMFAETAVLLGKVYVYAAISHQVDTADNGATSMVGKAVSLFGQFNAAASFIDPELVQIGLDTLNQWMDREPELKIYRHYFEDLYRKQAHVRSSEVEEMLGMLAAPFFSTAETATMMTDADFRFPPACGQDGKDVAITQGTYAKILSSPDRELRRTAWQNYMDTYLAFKNTLANNLNTSIQQNVFSARTRRYNSTLEASLFQNNIPAAVFHNLIQTYQRFLPIWHRYFKVRRKALGVDKLYTYDIWAPLTAHHPTIPYLQAVEMISAGLAPMGEEYVNNLRRGVLEQHWVDVYPNQGKSSAQFSSGTHGTFPFIVINYDDSIFSLSTLAHELGHSMHSFYTWKTQPVIYSDYSLFVAEVASNFHQAMVRSYLLATNPDPDFQISVIEEAMDNFHRYFFIMPTLARFELEMHEHAERGEGLSADLMIDRMAELYAEGYGGEVELDPQRDGITWATFGHLYLDYYVYQYATGISGAHALSRRILNGEAGAAERYLGFLKSGSSNYPLDVLKAAGVDLTAQTPIEETYQVLDGLVGRLEKLIDQRK
jgi:oligoendopeptidase F